MSNILFNTLDGKPVFNPASIASRSANPNLPAEIAAQLQSCICGGKSLDFGNEGEIVLSYTNGGLTAASVKIPPAANFYEAYNGSAGADFFNVDNFPNGAGTVSQEDGTLLYGTNVIRAMTQSMALVIGEMRLTGTFVGTNTTKFIDVLKGNLFKADTDTIQVKAETIANNAVNILVNRQIFYWTMNKGLRIANVAPGDSLSLTLKVIGVKFYTELF